MAIEERVPDNPGPEVPMEEELDPDKNSEAKMVEAKKVHDAEFYGASGAGGGEREQDGGNGDPVTSGA